MKRNSITFGIIIGALAPLLGLLVYYFWKFYPTYSIGEFFSTIFANKSVLSALSTFALFINVALITVYFNQRKDETGKGIFIISCIYAIAAILIKFFS